MNHPSPIFWPWETGAFHAFYLFTIIALVLVLVYVIIRYAIIPQKRIHKMEIEKSKKDLLIHAEMLVEHEKKNIAMELHDSILPSLSLVRLYNNSPEADDTLKHVINRLRDVSHILRGVAEFDTENAAESIKSMIKLYANKYGLITNVQIDEYVLNNEYTVEYKYLANRIISEALNNIIKHSRANFIVVNINRRGFTIMDNGCGFNAKEVKEGIGIKNMKDRASKIEAVFSISSKIGEGTTITVTLP